MLGLSSIKTCMVGLVYESLMFIKDLVCKVLWVQKIVLYVYIHRCVFSLMQPQK